VATAETDSLTFYVEQLEHDLLLAEIRYEARLEVMQANASARADSLTIANAYLAERLHYAQSQARRWYHDPRLWYTAGVATGAILVATAVDIYLSD